MLRPVTVEPMPIVTPFPAAFAFPISGCDPAATRVALLMPLTVVPVVSATASPCSVWLPAAKVKPAFCPLVVPSPA